MSINPKDKNSDNPRVQCSVCGQWKRLFGRKEDGGQIQRFFPAYLTLEGKEVEHKDAVCYECESKLPDWKPFTN